MTQLPAADVQVCQFCDSMALFFYQDYIEDPDDGAVYFALVPICYTHLVELEMKR